MELVGMPPDGIGGGGGGGEAPKEAGELVGDTMPPTGAE